eukprot:SM000043S15779  [mRNA]  locus=s43:3944:5253:- [translate_table: standard]
MIRLIRCQRRPTCRDASHSSSRRPLQEPPPAGAPAFNYNVSHDGALVVLAAEAACLVGADVAAIPARYVNGDVGPAELLRLLRGQLSPAEWAAVGALASAPAVQLDALLRRAPPPVAAAMVTFPRRGGYHPASCICMVLQISAARSNPQRLWSCKEAYAKAIGVGLGLELRLCEFQPGCPPKPSTAALAGRWRRRANAWPAGGGGGDLLLRLDGIERPDWRFDLSQLAPGHWVCVARGPLADATPSLRATFSQAALAAAPALAMVLAAPAPPFEWLVVRDLVPDGCLAAFDALCGTTNGGHDGS